MVTTDVREKEYGHEPWILLVMKVNPQWPVLAEG